MSKEMKMADYFDLPLSALCRDAYGNELNFEDMSISELQAISHAINNHDSLAEENTALREAMRLKEAECEALAGDVIEWREVKETMPPIGCPVLAIGGALNEARIASFESDFNIWCWLNGDICEWDYHERPTHWMPLPELPSCK